MPNLSGQTISVPAQNIFTYLTRSTHMAFQIGHYEIFWRFAKQLWEVKLFCIHENWGLFLLNIGLFSMWTNCYTTSVVSKWQTAIRSQTAGSIFTSRKECIRFKTSHWFLKVAFISGSQILSYSQILKLYYV